VRDLVDGLIAEGAEARVRREVKEGCRSRYTAASRRRGRGHTIAANGRSSVGQISCVAPRRKCDPTRGFANLEDRKGRPALLVLGDPIPEDLEVLPSPEPAAGSCCRRCWGAVARLRRC
jgi:hypothetical protein